MRPNRHTESAAAEPVHGRARPARSRWRRHRGWWIAALVVIALLLTIQLAGSPIAKSMLNDKLAAMPDYAGHAEGVKLAFWRGTVNVRGFVLYERGFEDQPPLLRVAHTSLKIAPGALLSGKLGGRVTIDGLEMNLVKRIDDETGAAGRDPEEREAELKQEAREKKEAVKRWQDQLRDAVPMELTRFELENGRVHFVDVTTDPHAEFTIEQMRVVATDLQNRPKANGDPMPAKLEVQGVMSGGGQMRASVQLDPMARQPLFAASFEVRELELPPINNFLRAYADADVSRGTFEVFSEIEARDGRYEGYVKPLFHDLDFENAGDEDRNVVERLKETVVSAVASVLENEDEEQVATRTPFEGNFDDNEVDIWTTIATLFRNAFIEALRGGFDRENSG